MIAVSEYKSPERPDDGAGTQHIEQSVLPPSRSQAFLRDGSFSLRAMALSLRRPISDSRLQTQRPTASTPAHIADGSCERDAKTEALLNSQEQFRCAD